MCEFCTEHGEGYLWYLQMKNYSRELLQADMTFRQKQETGVKTRYEWLMRFWECFIMPAVSGLPATRDPFSAGGWQSQPSPDEILAGRKIEHFGQVLPIEDIDKIIDHVDSITRMPCGCRFLTTGLADKRYCFGIALDRLGVLGKFPEASISLEVLEKDEAKEIFRKFDQEGLVHSIWTGVTPYVVGICNCDRDCGAYKGYIEQRGSPNFFRAEYICQVDWDLCIGCKSCMSQCQFGAEFYSSALGKVYIDPRRCFGCGVCRVACPNDAISLVRRQDIPVAAGLW